MWLIAVAAMVVACSEDEGAPVTPSFPEEEQILSVKAGESVEIVFDASMDWKLYSSTLWCRFSNGMTSISGQAGKQAVQVSVNEDMLNYGEMQAEITLKQGDVEKVIAKLTRQGEGLWVTDANGNYFSEENLIPFFYREIGKGVDINFTTNYDWTVEEYPEWLVVNEAPLKGLGFRPGNISVTVKNEFSAFAKKGDIKVKRTGTDDFVNIPVNFYGIDRVSSDKNAWGGWTFNSDGGKYSTSNSMTGESDEFDAPLVMQNVLVNGNDYEVLYFEEQIANQYVLVDNQDAWMSLKVNQQQNSELKEAQLSVKNNEGNRERSGVVMIMPKDTLGFIGRDNLLTSSGVFTDCADKYVLIAISQKSAFITSSDFEVISDSQEPIMVLKVDSPSDEDIEYCGTNNIYKVRLQPHTSYSTFKIVSNVYADFEVYLWHNLSQDEPVKYPSWGTNDFCDYVSSYIFLNGISETNGYDEKGDVLKPLCIVVRKWDEQSQSSPIVAAILIYRE